MPEKTLLAGCANEIQGRILPTDYRPRSWKGSARQKRRYNSRL